MTYTPPPLESLQMHIDSLDVKNSDHPDLVRFLKNLLSFGNHNVLMAGLILVKEMIAASYRFFSPESDLLYREMTSVLNISKDAPSDKEKIIYFSHLFQCIEKKDSAEYKALEDLSKNIVENPIHLQPDIDLLLKQRPTPPALHYHFGMIKPKYHDATKNDRTRNIKRDEQVILLDFIDHLFPYNPQDKQQLYYTVRLGALLYCINTFREEYKRDELSLRCAVNLCFYSIANSRLNKLCREVMNIESTQEIPKEKQKVYLANFCAAINTARESVEAKNILKRLRFNNVSISDDPDTFLQKIDDELAKQFITVNPQDPSFLGRSYNRISNAAELGLNVCLNSVAENGAKALENGAVTAAASAAALYFIGPAAVPLATFAAHQAMHTVLKDAAGLATNVIVPPVRFAVKTTAYLARGTYQAVASALTKETPPEKKIDKSKEWITALLRLPSHIFSEKKKMTILYVEDVSRLDSPRKEVKTSALPALRN